jgi:hypothetical protein
VKGYEIEKGKLKNNRAKENSMSEADLDDLTLPLEWPVAQRSGREDTSDYPTGTQFPCGCDILLQASKAGRPVSCFQTVHSLWP